MEYSYYKWFFFLDSEHEIDLENSPRTYFKTYYEESIKLYVSIRIDGERENGIYYHDVLSINSLREYHLKNHEDTFFYVVKHLDGTILLERYRDFNFVGMEIFHFDENKQEIANTKLDRNYRLTQYTETYYDDENEPIREKHFIVTKHWQIHEEDLTQLG